MFGMGYQELLVVLVIVLLLFGPKNLPKLANSIGRAVRDFKSGLGGIDREIQDELNKADAPEAKPSIEPPETAIPTRQVSQDEKVD
jgi:sec-independent protein translocase protein TatA